MWCNVSNRIRDDAAAAAMGWVALSLLSCASHIAASVATVSTHLYRPTIKQSPIDAGLP